MWLPWTVHRCKASERFLQLATPAAPALVRVIAQVDALNTTMTWAFWPMMVIVALIFPVLLFNLRAIRRAAGHLRRLLVIELERAIESSIQPTSDSMLRLSATSTLRAGAHPFG